MLMFPSQNEKPRKRVSFRSDVGFGYSSDDEEDDPWDTLRSKRRGPLTWIVKFFLTWEVLGWSEAVRVFQRERKVVDRERRLLDKEHEGYPKEGSIMSKITQGLTATKLAVGSRLVVLGIQMIATNLMDIKHENDGFKWTPIEGGEEGTKVLDPIVKRVIGGFANWDGQYFVHVAMYGYTEEKMMAFFPMFPITLRLLSTPVHWIVGSIISFSSLILISGWILNFICFVESAKMMYDLAKLTDGIVSPTSVVFFFCFNPASIFFSSLYTESLFMFLTLKVLLSLYKRNPYQALTWASLSALCRSNGVLNFGFIAAFFLQEAFNHQNVNMQSLHVAFQRDGVAVFKSMTLKLPVVGLFLLPFLLFQVYGIQRFCDKRNSPPPYCRFETLAYSYVQKQYWDVGPFRYFQLKQIPNFLLALPVLWTQITKTWRRLNTTMRRFCAMNSGIDVFDSAIAAQGLFLGLFCFVCIHVQVSTRLILSAFPPIYLYVIESCQRELVAFRRRLIPWTIEATFLQLWCGLYFVIGTVAFSLGYPWT